MKDVNIERIAGEFIPRRAWGLAGLQPPAARQKILLGDCAPDTLRAFAAIIPPCREYRAFVGRVRLLLGHLERRGASTIAGES